MSISQELVDKIIELRECGISYRQIAQQVGVGMITAREYVLINRPDLRLVTKGKNPPRNQSVIDTIISLREQRFTQSSIAAQVNLSRERVRQLVNKHCPQLSGREYLFLWCDNCDYESTVEPGAFHRRQYGDHRICLCSYCWKPFSLFRAAKKTEETYGHRYKFVMDQRARNQMEHGMGERYYNMLGEPVALAAFHDHWGWRMRKNYEGALKRLFELRQNNSWLDNFYDEIFDPITGASNGTN